MKRGKRLLTIFTAFALLALWAMPAAAIDWMQFKGTKLNVLGLEQAQAKGLKQLVPEFKKLTGIDVEITTMNQTNTIRKVAAELGGRSSTYDIVFVEGDRVPKYAGAGLLQPMDDYFKDPTLTDPKVLAMDDLIKSTMECFNYGGKQYGMPFFAACVMMYYRKDVFEDKGVKVPETLDDLLVAAKKIHSKEMPFIAMRGQAGHHNIWHWSQFLYGYGGHYFKDFPKDLHPALDSPEAIKATKVYAELMEKYSIPGAANCTYDDVVIAMQQGRVAMVLEGAPLGARILDPERSKVVGKLGFKPVPKGPAGVFPPFTAQAYLINAASKHKKAAYLFLQWYTSFDTLKKISLMTKHVAVTRKSLWNDPDFQKKYGFDYGAGSYLAAFQKTLELGYPQYRPPLKEWPQIVDVVGRAVQETYVGKKTPAQAMKYANKAVEKIMKRSGAIK